MQIYLMRHAQAAEPLAWPGPDKARPLTDEGVSRLEAALEHMKRKKLSADVLLTSPYERAGQTADLIARELHVLQTVQCTELAAGANFDDFSDVLVRHRHASPVWVVGHMPELSLFSSKLSGGGDALDRGFEPGEMVAIECHVDETGPAAGTMLWRRRLDDWKAA